MINDDPRIEDFLAKGLSKKETPRVALLGFPVDNGVKRNGVELVLQTLQILSGKYSTDSVLTLLTLWASVNF